MNVIPHSRGPLVLAIILLAGCATNRSPLALEPSSNTTGLSESLTLGAAAAAGGAGGYAVTHDGWGAAAGAGVGLLGGALANNLVNDARLRREAELVETAKRQTRAAIMDEYWQAERHDRSRNSSPAATVAEVSYSGGYFEGVNLAPRRAADSEPLAEPRRGEAGR